MLQNFDRRIISTVAVLQILISSVLCTLPDSNSTNAMMGVPEVTCTQEGVAFTMETENPFHGQLYVKDEYYNPKCRVSFKDVQKPGAAFRLTFNECGMRRQRMLNPRGMVYTMTMMVQFHDVFVTQGDRAYQIRCFYSEQQANLTNTLNVSPLTTQVMEATFPSPSCTYSIHQKSMDGPHASVVKVGDPIMHVYSCNFALETYKMLIKDCFVDDGKNQRQRIIDSDGCSLDETIMQTPHYHETRLEAFGESTVFKWPDESVVYFSCQIVLCMNEGGACEDVTPPKCNKKTKKRSAPNESNSKGQLEFDLEVKKLTVVENDVIRANAGKQQYAKLEEPSLKVTYDPTTNSSLLDDYLDFLRSHQNRSGSAHKNSTRHASPGKGAGRKSHAKSAPPITRRNRLFAENIDEDHLSAQACFGYETVAAFCVVFTLFVAVLTMITCKLCLPCCAGADDVDEEKARDFRGMASSRSDIIASRCESWCTHAEMRDERDDGGSSVTAYQQPIYAPLSMTSKQLLFSKLNLNI